MLIEELAEKIDSALQSSNDIALFYRDFFTTDGDVTFTMVNEDGDEVSEAVSSYLKLSGELKTLISDSFSETIASKVTVDTGELDEQLQLGTSHVVKVLTDQGGTITSSDSFNVHHAGETDNAIEWVTNYYDARYPDSDLNEITAEDKILTADGEIILRPNLQADDRSSDGVEMSFSMEEVNLLRQIINSKEIIVGTEQNREDGTYSRLYKNELQLKSIHEDIGNVSAVLNMFDNGESLELNIFDDDRNALSRGIKLYSNKDIFPKIDNFDILTARIRYIYVDSEIGDDTNEGTSPDRPKKTFIAGFIACRYRHDCVLYLAEGQEFDVDSNIDSGYNTLIRVIRRGSTDDVDDPKLKFGGYRYTSGDGNDYSGTKYISASYGSSIGFERIELIPPGKTDDLDFQAWDFQSSLLISSGGIFLYLYNCTCDITGLTGCQVIKQSRYRSICTFSIYGSDITLGSEYFLYNRSNSPVVAYIDYGRFSNDDDLKDQMFKNVIRDADTGIPININSNFDVTK